MDHNKPGRAPVAKEILTESFLKHLRSEGKYTEEQIVDYLLSINFFL